MKKTKGDEIYGNARVVRIGSAPMNGVPWETPHCVFEMLSGPRKGEKFCWHSERVETLRIGLGEEVYLYAFVRQSTGKLYRVSFPLRDTK